MRCGALHLVLPTNTTQCLTGGSCAGPLACTLLRCFCCGRSRGRARVALVISSRGLRSSKLSFELLQLLLALFLPILLERLLEQVLAAQNANPVIAVAGFRIQTLWKNSALTISSRTSSLVDALLATSTWCFIFEAALDPGVTRKAHPGFRIRLETFMVRTQHC